MSDLLDDGRYSDLDPVSVRMIDLSVDRAYEVLVAASDADRDAFDDHDDEAYDR